MQISNVSFGTKLLIRDSTCSKLTNQNNSFIDGILIAGEVLKTDKTQDEFALSLKSQKNKPDALQLTYFDEDKRLTTITEPIEIIKNKNSNQVALTLINIKNGLKNRLIGEPANLNNETSKTFKSKKVELIEDKYGCEDFTYE